MTTLATALAVAIGTAVEAWLVRAGIGRRKGLLGFSSGDEGGEAAFAAWSAGGETLLLLSCGEGEFAAAAGDAA